MTTASAAPASHRRILFASLVGTSVEFYDFYIYATAAALVFPTLFFPSQDPALQQLLSYASFSVAFFARPLGGLVFGHFGDRMGRKSTLVASLMLMGLSTVLIAFLPGYAVLGWVAPALLCLLRFGQGLGLGGEWGGASLLAVENAPPGWANRYGAFPPMGAPVGFIFANGFFLILGALLTDEQFREWGWRLPFLASALLVALGLWVRVTLTETPAFVEAQHAAPPPKVPLGELLRAHWLPTIAGTVGTVACFALFYISTVFVIGYGTKTLGYGRETFLAIELAAILFMAAGIVAAVVLADRTSAARVLVLGCIATLPVGMAMAALVTANALLGVFAWLALALFVMGFVYGPLGGWLPSLFPARVRYTGVSVTFNLGGIIGGGLTPFIAETLVKQGGLWLVGAYLAGAGALSLAGLALTRRR
ncbi:MFS transporter [Sphingomonas hengshuiensis]|uniref:MFS transporter n=1 Tax=Sphingomonas hengshuiensis TaxID=1609977 RepID=A0A7U4LET5_9SPHN|nr:MFS transporter [Sphingomonas hengshuiensis]AJP71563.1 MFS transporter [Sphingomonas hengshuiensis]